MKNFEEKVLQKLEEIERVVKNQQKPLMNLEQCSQYLGISKSSLYSKIAKQEIGSYRFGKRILFRTSEVDELILNEKNKVKSKEEIKSEIATRILVDDIGGNHEKS